jgi:hypothetical protein
VALEQPTTTAAIAPASSSEQREDLKRTPRRRTIKKKGMPPYAPNRCLRRATRLEECRNTRSIHRTVGRSQQSYRSRLIGHGCLDKRKADLIC